MAASLPLLQCSLRYIAIYLLLAVCFGFIQVWFDLTLGALATLATLAGAICYVAFWVVRRRASALTSADAFKLSLCSVLMTLLFVALIVALLLLRDDLRGYLALFDRTGLLYAGLLVFSYLCMALLLQWVLYYLFARLHYRVMKKGDGVNSPAVTEGHS